MGRFRAGAKTTFRPEPEGESDPGCLPHERLPVVAAVMIVVIVVALIVVVAVVFMVPVAFMDRPTLLVVVVVRIAPMRPLIGRPLPGSTSPFIPPAAPGPIAVGPNITRTWHRSLDLIPHRWRGTTDIDAHLGKSRSCKSRSQDHAHYPCCSHCLFSSKRPPTFRPYPGEGIRTIPPLSGAFEATSWACPVVTHVLPTLGPLPEPDEDPLQSPEDPERLPKQATDYFPVSVISLREPSSSLYQKRVPIGTPPDSWSGSRSSTPRAVPPCSACKSEGSVSR
jgi:hypothetical protein